MSDEEKKAIERLNKRYEFFKENPLATNVWLTLDIHNLGIALNLIEKQSKEIEELKDKYSDEKIRNTIIKRLLDTLVERIEINSKTNEPTLIYVESFEKLYKLYKEN